LGGKAKRRSWRVHRGRGKKVADYTSDILGQQKPTPNAPPISDHTSHVEGKKDQEKVAEQAKAIS